MRMPWCDTIPAVLSTLIAVVLFLMAALFNAANFFTPWPLAVMRVYLHLNLVLVLPLWIVLRALDWACAGPLRRKSRLI